MAKDLKALVANLANIGKAASAETQVSDPANKGEISTSVPTERTIAPLPGQSADLNVPAVAADEPAGDQKIEGGESTGKVPGATDFVEPVTVAGAKSAGLIAGANDLRTKLANFGKELSTPAAAPAPAAKEASASPAAKPADYVPGDYLFKVACHLMESSEGLNAINRALDDILDADQRDALMKQATDEHADLLRNYTINRMAQAEYEVEQEKIARAVQAQEAAYQEMIAGATPEQRENIEKSASLIKAAADIFAENPLGSLAAQAGIVAAQKVAAAVEGGMPPEMAAQLAAQDGAGQGGEEGPPTPEELEAALMVLVEQGLISEEEAMQLMQEISAGGGAAGAEGAPMPEEEAQKQAALNEALDKIASVIF